MDIPVTVTPPQTLDAIVRELGQVHGQSAAYWAAFPTAAFLAPLGAAWSPADNVRHLTKSIRAVARGLAMPRALLWVAFGPPRRPSRGYEELRETYLAALAAGGQAGRYAPQPQPAEPDAEARRARIMARHDAAAAELEAAIGRWTDGALDRYRLPHPLLGKLTVREMLLFTLYHNVHHVRVVARRIAGQGAAPDIG